MNKQLTTAFLLLIVLVMAFSACTPATTIAPTQAAAPTIAPTQPPAPTATIAPTEVTVVAPDIEALYSELIASIPADKGYGAIAPAKLNEELVEKPPFLLDVREAGEVEKDGFIKDSVNIPVREVLQNLDKLPAPDQPIVVLCASGHRAAMVMSALRLLGYSNVSNMAGGLAAWKKAELPVEMGKPAEAESISSPVVEDTALLTTLDEFISNLPEGFYAVKADGLNATLADGNTFVLDVRTQKEYDETGRIAGATNIPLQDLFANLDKLPAKDTPIVTYCVSGHRAAVAMMGLKLLGYEKVTNLGGGINGWKAAKFPVEGWVDWNAAWADYLSSLPEGFYAVTAPNLNAALAEKTPFLLDVREASEVEKDGLIAGAVNIPVRGLLMNLDKLPSIDTPIVIYCASGHRGALAMAALQHLGYEDVTNLAGGLAAWKKAELPVETGKPAEPQVGTEPKLDETMLLQLDKFLSELPEGFSAIKPADLNIALGDANKPFVLDVRKPDELTTDGAIEGAVNVPVNELFSRLAELPKDKATPIVVYCKSGHRAALAMMALQMNGYTDVRNMGGGFNAWVAAQLPVTK
ncbi:MAG: hypothetical protein EHM21_01970 [Chloroflexi bacterium]|nr:MAG: hypothetical protein EHM21_01970 [Chloroflexota bacterium]